MKENTPKEKPHELRKKIKRVEDSRIRVQNKSREKSKAIKAYQDREQELKENRDNWKVKYKEQSKENVELREQLKILADALEITEEQLQAVRDEFNAVKKNPTKDSENYFKTKRSWYPFCIILLCVRLVLIGASPLRTASNSLALTFQALPELKNYSAPSPTTIKRWIQKVGYYKLTAPKSIANDWMIIVDASIQLGAQKCVLFLGCRQINLPTNRPLTPEDLEILSLRITSSLKSDMITEELKSIESKIGKIISVCSDQGSDVVRGIKNFQLTNGEIRLINDTAHKIANILEAVLEKNERWIKFREQVTLSRRRMHNSSVVGAQAPTPRSKARYMNVGSLIKWAADMLTLLRRHVLDSGLNIDELKKYLGWLTEFEEDIHYWDRLISIGQIACDLVRREGIHMTTCQHFENAVSSFKTGSREIEFVDKIAIFLLKQSDGMVAGERYIGSTEVIETIFGKIKFMEYEQTVFGFTSLVLAGAAYVGSKDETIIQEAMISVKQSQIDEWSKKEIGQSVQTQRNLIKKEVKNLKQEMEPKHSGFTKRKKECF